MKKAVCVSIILMLSLFMPSYAWSECPSTWAEDGVKSAIDLGIIPKDLQSDYNKPITREEFCQTINALNEKWTLDSKSSSLESLIVKKNLSINSNTFSDTNNITIQFCATLGIVGGVGGGKFNPDATITRQEAATMLFRAADVLTPLINEDETSTHTTWRFPHLFDDSKNIHNWAYKPIMWSYRKGIMGGVGKNLFDGLGSYTREQTFLTMLRLYYLHDKQKEGTDVFVKAAHDYFPTDTGYVDETLKTYTKDELGHIYPLTRKYAIIGSTVPTTMANTHSIIDQKGKIQLTDIPDLNGGNFYHGDIYYDRFAQIDIGIGSFKSYLVDLDTKKIINAYVNNHHYYIPAESDGMLCIYYDEGAGYINCNNGQIVGSNYSYAGNFDVGKAVVQDEALNSFLIDKTGKILKNFNIKDYTILNSWGEFIILENSKSKVALYSAKRGFITNFKFDNLTLTKNGQYIGGNSGYYTLYNPDGSVASKTYANAFDEVDKDRYLAWKSDTQRCFIDQYGNELITISAPYLTTDGSGVYAYTPNSKDCVIINHYGEVTGGITLGNDYVQLGVLNGMITVGEVPAFTATGAYIPKG